MSLVANVIDSDDYTYHANGRVLVVVKSIVPYEMKKHFFFRKKCLFFRRAFV